MYMYIVFERVILVDNELTCTCMHEAKFFFVFFPLTLVVTIGYPNFGSDIGGYRSGEGDLGRTKELLIRWAQLGAFSPLMENGGNKEHRPWVFDDQTLKIYKE